MKLAEVCVKRPVLTIMMIFALLVLGYSSFDQMYIDDMPDVDFPFVIVQTIYPGAGAEAVESEVSKKIEDAIAPIEGVKHVVSQSQEGYSMVFAEFRLEIESKDASQEVREKISQIRDQLPQDIEEPIIARYDPASHPIISLAVSGQRPLKDITRIVKDDIQKRLESIPGVGAVTLIGGFEREINIFLDIDKMESYEITANMVKGSIQGANIEIPGGRVNERNIEYVVKTLGKLTSVDQFNDIVIDNPHGQPVYLHDIATVVDGVEEIRSMARIDGQEAITLDINKQSGANSVEIAHMVKDEMVKIKNDLPPDMNIDVIIDNSTFTEDSIHEIYNNIFIGGLLAIFVVFLFLGDGRPTFITALAIPTSIVATFTFMNMLGFTLNNMSLMGLSLAVGFLIDDAIVVIENLYRHIKMGKTAVRAAIDASKEIGLAVMATTFSIVVVFIPVAFMQGIVGRFFFQFGMTVAVAVMMSLFVAFSLTPMLSSRWLNPEGYENKPPRLLGGRKSPFTRKHWWEVLVMPFYFLLKGIIELFNIVLMILWHIYKFFVKMFSFWDPMINSLYNPYKAILAWTLRYRFVTMAIAALIFVLSLYVGTLVGSEFFPVTDRNQVIIDIETPPGTDLEVTIARFAEIEQILFGFDEVDLVYTTTGSGNDPVNDGRIYIKLVDQDLRERSAQEMVSVVRDVLKDIPGIKYAVASEQGEGGGERPVEISIRGSDIDILTELAHQVEDIFKETYGTIDVDNTLEEGKPELTVNVDRARANDLAVNIYGIASTIKTMIEGEKVTRFKDDDKEYDVRIQLQEGQRQNAEDIGRLLIASDKEVDGKERFLVPLAHVADVEKRSSIGKYNRYDRQREVKVRCNVTADVFAGTVIEEILAKTVEIDLPPGYNISVSGEGEIMQESFAHLNMALFLSIIFIFILLASQFESFFDPFSIMISLPLSLIGALLGLYLTNSSLSIMSMIGIILLMGLVTKNAILLVDFIKQNRRQGESRLDAILIAGPIRLRPILMTTMSTILGMLPLALALGPGAEFRAPMARAVIGGLISSSVLTLLIVPVVYTIIDDIVAFFTGKETIRPDEEQDGENVVETIA